MAAVKPVFTVAQANSIRRALKAQIQFYSENGMDYRACSNALRRLDSAHHELLARRAFERARRKRHTEPS